MFIGQKNTFVLNHLLYMKLQIKVIAILLVTIGLLFQTNSAKATHMMGSEITYKSISPFKYKVQFVVYRDCTGVNLGGISAMISCGTNSNSLSPTKKSVRDATPNCKNTESYCKNTNSSLNIGIEEHTYEAIIDLTQAPYSTWILNGCKEFTVSWGQCCRNSEITTGQKNANFYTYCTINIDNAVTNNSPQFVSPQQAYLCCNIPARITAGAVDLIDFDSISYKLVDPLIAAGQKASYNTPHSATNPMTSYCPGSPNCNPRPTLSKPQGFYLNEITGEIVFTPVKCDEVGIVCIEMTEWRKDSAGVYKEIGKVRRDMQLIVQNCGPNSPPVMKFTNRNLTVDANLCAPKTCIKIAASDLPHPADPNAKKDSIYIKALSLPEGVKATYSNQNTTNPSVELCFESVSNSAYGKKINIIFQAEDDACPLNAISQEVMVVTIKPKDSVTHIRGYSFEDSSKNCLRENGEIPTIQRKIAYSNKNIYVETAEDGSYGLCIPTGMDTIKVMPHPFYFDDCPEVIKDFKLDSIYNIDFGTKGKKGIWGKVFTSTDKSCDTTKNLKPITQIQVVAMPGNYQSTTDDYGNYALAVPAGTYKVYVKDARKNYDLCLRDTLSVVVNNANDVVKDANFYFKGAKPNYFIGKGSFFLRAGRFNKICLNVAELNKTGTDSTLKVKLELPLKSGDSLTSSSAAKITGNVIEWELKDFDKDYFDNICFNWYLDTTWKIDDTLSYKATINRSVWQNDVDTNNNVSITNAMVVNSYDPNIKATFQDTFVTPLDRDLDYNVQFQNEGTDTAYYVEVRDTLSEHLDLHTFKMQGASHQFQYFLMNNVLHVIFDGINLTAMSKDEENSIGNFSYSIQLKEGIKKETLIPNSASIYFDLNPPVRTNTHQNVVKSPIEVLSINKAKYCAGEVASITYQTWYNPIKGNNFNIELSDKNGDFANATIIKSVSKDSTKGELNFEIPKTAKTGTYKIRVTGSLPNAFTFEEVYSKDFNIVEQLGGKIIALADSICSYDKVTLDLNKSYNSIKYYTSTGLLGTATTTKSFGPFNNSQKIHATYEINGCTHYTDTLDLFVSDLVTAEIVPNLVFCDYDKNQVYKRKIQPNDSLLSNTSWKVNASTKIDNGTKETLNYNYPKAGTYSIELNTETKYGCKDLSIKTVQIIEKPDASFNVNMDSTCTNNAIQITPSFNNGNHAWEFGDGNTGTSKTAFNLNYPNSGKFTVSHLISIGQGCKDTAIKDVVVLEKPVANFTLLNNKLCLGSNGKIELSYTKQKDFEEVLWSFGDGNTSSMTSVSHNYTSAGVFDLSLEVTIPGCSNTKTEKVTISPQPKVSFSTDKTQYCEGEEMNLTNTSTDEGNANYQWVIDGVNAFTTKDATYKNSNIGNNLVKLIIKNLACSDSSEKVLEVLENPSISLFADEVCAGLTTNFTTTLNNTLTNNVNYNYTFGDGNSQGPITGISPLSHTYASAGTYQAKVIADHKGCEASTDIEVKVNPNPVADFIFSDIPGSLLTILIQNTSLIADRSQWTKENLTFQEDNNSFELTFNKPGEYNLKLVVESKEGCLDSIEKTVNVLGKGMLFAPTAFTPNGDNLNDFWAPFSMQQIQVNYKIFNRWGEIVFVGKDQDQWDGTYGGSPAKMGTYIYVIESLNAEGQTVKTNGHFQLIR